MSDFHNPGEGNRRDMVDVPLRESVADLTNYSDKQKIREIPEVVLESHRNGRWNADTAEKWAFLYTNKGIWTHAKFNFTSLNVSLNYSRAAIRAAIEEKPIKEDKTSVLISKFLQFTGREVKEYVATKEYGLQTAERRELFTRYAAIMNWMEDMNQEPLDEYDETLRKMGLKEFKPKGEEKVGEKE